MPIVHNLVWAPLKNCTSSEAFKFILRRDNFMIYFNVWFSGTILWFVLSGRHYISEHVSISLQQKSLSGAQPGFSRCAHNFQNLPLHLTQFSRNVSPLYLLILLTRWGYMWMKWHLQPACLQATTFYGTLPRSRIDSCLICQRSRYYSGLKRDCHWAHFDLTVLSTF